MPSAFLTVLWLSGPLEHSNLGQPGISPGFSSNQRRKVQCCLFFSTEPPSASCRPCRTCRSQVLASQYSALRTSSYLTILCLLQALQSIAELRCLQQLVLADCSAVTTGGLEQLSGLVGLHHLALLRCPRVGDQGMTLLRCLTRLTHLALTGCSKVPSQLTVLLAHPSTLRIYITLTCSSGHHSTTGGRLCPDNSCQLLLRQMGCECRSCMAADPQTC